MPLYHYLAIDTHGKKRKGLIDAQSDKEAKDKLRDQGLMISSLKLKVGGTSRENLRGDGLLNFTVQLSQLVSAGIPVYESLLALEEQYRGEAVHRIILSLCEQIKAGIPISQAMASFPQSFNTLYCSMMAAGESAGALNIVLERLSILIAKQLKLKREITTSMIYPGILASFSLVVITLLMTFVVPSIEGIFEGRKLNTFTALVLKSSHLFRDYWWLYLPIGLGSLIFLIYKIRSPSGQLWMQRHFLRLPLLRTLMIQTAVARFCRTMGTLQQGGLPLIDSLHIASDVMRNVVLEEEMQLAQKRIIEGSSLSIEIAKSKWFPKMVSRMLAVGEDSGTTTHMLNKIADIYEEDIEKTLNRLMALAQPLILVFMGSIIGLVLMAILLPLTDISSISM